jgi:NifB/MoaA-like Fe-S oxidoreductase
VFAGGSARGTQISDVRTHAAAIVPSGMHTAGVQSPANVGSGSVFGTMLTGEMFAPILREQIEKFNAKYNTRLHVLAVPNTYFGGDVSVAGLLTGKDLLAVRDQIVGDFVTIPKVTIKSDEPIFLDGMTFADLQEKFPVPVIPVDLDTFFDIFK